MGALSVVCHVGMDRVFGSLVKTVKGRQYHAQVLSKDGPCSAGVQVCHSHQAWVRGD